MIKIEDIKYRLYIEDVLKELDIPFKRRGTFRCPFPEKHANGDRNPSCTLWEDHKGIKCFACGYNANLFDIVQNVLNINTAETVIWFENHFPFLKADLQEEKPTFLPINRLEGQKMLAQSLSFSEEALQRPCEEGYLSFYLKEGIKYWAISEQINDKLKISQERRLDGNLIVLKDGSTTKCRTGFGSVASCPIGIQKLKENVILCEGGTDFLAAYQLMWSEEMEDYFSPVAILGAGQRIHEECLPYFEGKNILIFPDYDEAGMKGCRTWEAQLKAICKHLRVFDFCELKQQDGTSIKDLRDFLKIDPNSFDNEEELQRPLSSFIRSVKENIAFKHILSSSEAHSLIQKVIEPILTLNTDEEFPSEYDELPPFPMASLPQDMQHYINEICRIKSVNPTMFAPQVLSTIGGLTEKHVKICIVENNEYLRLNTYTYIIAGTGSGKSRSSKCILDVLVKFEEHLLEKGQKLLVEDITSEQLVVRLYHNNERIFIFSQDGRSQCNNILGAYKKHGTDEAIYLKGYSGDFHDTERKIDHTNIRLQSPCINMLVLVQPDKAYELAENKELFEGGFLARCFLVNAYQKNQKRNRIPITINENAYNIGQVHFQEIFETFYWADKDTILYFDEEAYSLIIDFGNEQDLNDEFANRYAEFLMKIVGQLHVWLYGKRAWEVKITPQEVEKGICVIRWYITHQKYFLSGLKRPHLEGKKNHLVAFLRSKKEGYPRSLITKDAHITARDLDSLLAAYPELFIEEIRKNTK